MAGAALASLACSGLAPSHGFALPTPAPDPAQGKTPAEADLAEAHDHEEWDGPSVHEVVEGPERGVPVPEPAPGQEVLPLLTRPFDGDYPTSGFLDHDGARAEGQLTPWGARVLGRSGHKGHDWAMPVGTPLLAMADGIVETARDQGAIRCGGKRVDSSILVRIRHPGLLEGDDLATVYLHLSKLAVREGDRVRAGQVVAWSGNTGCSSGPHLHLGVLRVREGRRHDLALDPYGWAGEGPDPFDPDRDGRSPWLWKAGHAPALFRLASAHPSREGRGPQFRRTITTVWRDDPLGEIVEIGITPRGGPDVRLDGWSLRAADGSHRWDFPAGAILRTGTLLRIVTGRGDDADDTLYMDRDEGVWDDRGVCIELRDARGRLVDRMGFAGVECS